MLQTRPPYQTVEEYLWEEERAESKHEYYRGTVYAMAGGSPEHSQIAVNLTTALTIALQNRDCRAFNSDLKIGVPGKPKSKNRKQPKENEDFITYPDASVFCGPMEFYKGDRRTLANPLALFEVLSPSTRHYDRTFKLEQYRKISSLQLYVMIDSEQVKVEYYYRVAQNGWLLEGPLEDLNDVLRLEALEIEILLRNLYNKVEFTLEEVSPPN